MSPTSFSNCCVKRGAILPPPTAIGPSPFLAPVIAELIGDPAAHDRAALHAAWNTRLGNLLGLAAITLPAGASDGLPVGLMLLDQPFREGALLRLAAAAEVAMEAAMEVVSDG